MATSPICETEGKMIDVGRLCVKTAGRDAGLKCVVVDIADSKLVLIDGETRRRKCNIAHLEPLNQVLDIKKGASHDDVRKELEKLGLKARDTKPKEKKERPVSQKRAKAAEVKGKAQAEKSAGEKAKAAPVKKEAKKESKAKKA